VRAVATLQLDDFETWPELTIRSVEPRLRVSSEPLHPARLGSPSTLARGVLSAENATRGFESAHCVQVEISMRSTQSLGTSASLSAAVVTPSIDGRPHPTPRVKSGPHKWELILASDREAWCAASRRQRFSPMLRAEPARPERRSS
jgi:hypothetical protein